ncbi:hypothetical protein EDD86DRAFT_205847 [Gorgonomyces haynaldii]|nr:hypothetical protein EDD86DRAFT_205847 [Gorgonomyces haynaldii]
MHYLSIAASLLSLSLAAPATPVKSYQGYKVLRFPITQKNHVDLIGKVVSSYDGASIWTEHGQGTIDVMVKPDDHTSFLQDTGNLDHSVMVEDVQALIDAEAAHMRKNSALQSHLFRTTGKVNADTIFNDYQEAAVYVKYLVGLGGQQVTLGQSYLGTSITGVKFGTGSKQIVVHGGIHAREWISPAVTTYLASYLLGSSADAANLRSNFTFHFFPVLNVDGYAYTRSSDRLWRKNRQPNSGSSCVGVDPNRNFPYKWGGPGASSSPCADDYRGPSAFVAPETQAVYNYVKGLSNVVSYMDFHSYSQLFMFPYGYDCSVQAADYNVLLKGSQLAVSGIKGVNGKSFKNGPICQTIYQASGSSVDSMYQLGVKFAYTAELRDTGANGFILPASQIVPSGEEIVKGMSALYNYILTV